MKILLTGGNGFIGSNLRVHFEKNNINYTLLSRDEWMGNDNFTKLDSVINKGDSFIFIHLAGISNVGYCEDNYDECFQVNSYAVEKLLDKLKKDEIKEFIYASSMATYGDSNDKIVSENNNLDGFNKYAESKILGEKFVDSWVKNNNKIATILRIGNCYGSSYDGIVSPRGVLAYIINSILTGSDISLDFHNTSYKSAVKSFINLDDLSSLFLHIIENREKKNNLNIYNAVGDSYISIYDIFRFVVLHHRYNGVLNINFTNKVYNGVGSNDNIKSDYNWKPKSNLHHDILVYLNKGKNL
jgi:UDP-glucose 4-epimerase